MRHEKRELLSPWTVMLIIFAFVMCRDLVSSKRVLAVKRSLLSYSTHSKFQSSIMLFTSEKKALHSLDPSVLTSLFFFSIALEGQNTRESCLQQTSKTDLSELKQ